MTTIQRLPVEAGLDAERQLLDSVHAGALDCGLLFWRPQDAALVMPRRLSRLDGFITAQAACVQQGWPVALRDTGGEPVPQSPAVLNVALAYAVPASDDEQKRIETAYLRLCEPLRAWLRGLGLDPGLGEVDGAFCDGRYNVTLKQRKLAGTAQRWRRRPSDGRHLCLVHAAVLLENQRQAMVEVVNSFYAGCELPSRCRVASHVALEELLEDVWSATDGLFSCYRQQLGAAGLSPCADELGGTNLTSYKPSLQAAR
ncbi:lipoate--protein ligase family protein [Pseudomonas sp. SA3-5]|uniref:Lipoate--protein ligase family protein n=1 Tax=Pseudomonas aestuarii TaxID=3018340 RepID=A0ABT4XK12_9PSED|nr:lipoate--protein ligase family protein [Pseudomonas aestuarii]MDA7088571.1 lipoate--protein ligase family protein [Pseudomonas aestuarii]